MSRRARPIEGVVYRGQEEAAGWFKAGAWIDMTAGDALREAAQRWGPRDAIVSGGRRLSFTDFDALSERLGAALLEHGLPPGGRVMFQMGNEIETAIALFACFKAGLVPVCTVPQYGEFEMAALARASGAVAHFIQADFRASLDLTGLAARLAEAVPSLSFVMATGARAGEGAHPMGSLIESMPIERARARLAQVPIGSEDVLKFQLSGGSTGLPKIIPRFHAEYLGHSRDWALQFGKNESSVALWSLPLVHNGGQVWALFPTVLIGRTLVLTEPDIDVIFEAISREGVTHAMSIGPIAPKILAHPAIPRERLSSLHIFGAMNRAEALEAALGIPCANVYGLTEGMVSVTSPDRPAALRHGTNGTPGTPQNELKLLQPGTEEPVADDDIGELCFRGPSTLTGYFGDPEQTARAMTSDGFFRTGDLFRLETVGDDRYLVFVGRAKDNIDRGGEKFGVEDIEVLIGTHPDIADGRVVAMPCPVMGERACAFLVLRSGAKPPGVAELGRYLLSLGLAKFKLPERIEIIDSLPVTGVGKLDRARLRAIAAGRAGTCPTT